MWAYQVRCKAVSTHCLQGSVEGFLMWMGHFLSGALMKHNGPGVWLVGWEVKQGFKLSPLGAWWNTSWHVIEEWSPAAPWGHLSRLPPRYILPHTSFPAFCPVALCTSSNRVSTTSLGKLFHTQIEPALKKVALIFNSSVPFCNYIHSSLLYPFAWPWEILSLHPCAYTLTQGEYLILLLFVIAELCLFLAGSAETLISSSCCCSL